MCNSSNQAIIDQVINEKVSNNEMFTAWDITSEARKRGANEWHRDMKNAVHATYSYLQSQGYVRTNQLSIPGAKSGDANPWIYYPDGRDPQDYINNLLNTNVSTAVANPQTSTAPINVSTTPAVATASVSLNKGDADLDKDGRFHISKSVISEAGYKVGDIISVWDDNNGNLTLSPLSNHNGIVIGKYMVNADGRIRLNAKTLNKVTQFVGVTKFNVSVNGSSIAIRKA